MKKKILAAVAVLTAVSVAHEVYLRPQDANLITYTIRFQIDHQSEAWPNFRFTHYSPDKPKLYFPGQKCVGDGHERTCTVTVLPQYNWAFYVNTGKRPGQGSDLPELDAAGECHANAYVEVKKDGQDVPFRLLNAFGPVCHFVIAPNGKAFAGPNSDNDGVADERDCNGINPSINPRSKEVSGNDMDEDCRDGART